MRPSSPIAWNSCSPCAFALENVTASSSPGADIFEELYYEVFVPLPFPSRTKRGCESSFCAGRFLEKRASMTSRCSQWRCLHDSRICSIMSSISQGIPSITHARWRLPESMLPASGFLEVELRISSPNGCSHSVATRIVLPLRLTRLSMQSHRLGLSTQSESFAHLHCHHIGTDNRNSLRHCAVQLESGFRGMCGAVRQHVRSEVKSDAHHVVRSLLMAVGDIPLCKTSSKSCAFSVG